MNEIKSTNLRLNLEKPTHKAAWTYLQNLNKTEFKSYSNAIAVAVVDYFERYNRNIADPYFETRQREEKFVQEIISAVELSLTKILPTFLMAYLGGFNRPIQNYNSEKVSEISTKNEVDWDFLGE